MLGQVLAEGLGEGGAPTIPDEAAEAPDGQRHADGVTSPREIHGPTHVVIVYPCARVMTGRTDDRCARQVSDEANNLAISADLRDGKGRIRARGSQAGISEEQRCPEILHELPDKCGRTYSRA